MMNQYHVPADDEDFGNSDFSDMEWENRQLCTDGNCIGVIGPAGLCRQCGLPGSPRLEEGLETTAADQPYAHAERQEKAAVSDVCGEDDPDWSSRVLCGDGNCIGVIGPDGICKICKKPLESTG